LPCVSNWHWSPPIFCCGRRFKNEKDGEAWKIMRELLWPRLSRGAARPFCIHDGHILIRRLQRALSVLVRRSVFHRPENDEKFEDTRIAEWGCCRPCWFFFLPTRQRKLNMFQFVAAVCSGCPPFFLPQTPSRPDMNHETRQHEMGKEGTREIPLLTRAAH
jgi:hypothetical protein